MIKLDSILCGDCLSLLPMVDDHSVDMILCDMPYNSTQLKWDKKLDLGQLWEQYKRIIKDRGAVVLFAAEPFATRLRMSNMEWYKYDWHWLKNDATDCMNAKHRPMRKVEKILIFSNGTTANCSRKNMPYYPQGLINCIKRRSGVDYGSTGGSFKQYRPSHKAYIQRYTNYPCDVLYYQKDRERYHPTQKPVRLCEYLIETYTKEGGLVLDGFAGSGTTGIACVSTKRHFIVMEKDPAMYKIMKNRIMQARKVEGRKN